MVLLLWMFGFDIRFGFIYGISGAEHVHKLV